MANLAGEGISTLFCRLRAILDHFYVDLVGAGVTFDLDRHIAPLFFIFIFAAQPLALHFGHADWINFPDLYM